MHENTHQSARLVGREPKARTVAEGRTLTSLVQEGLRPVLAEESRDQSARREPLPTFGDPDGEFLVDLSDRDAL